MKTSKYLKQTPESVRKDDTELSQQIEMNRLNQLVLYYETTNLDQRNQIDHYKSLSEVTSIRILEQEKSIKALNSKIKNLEENMKYDKIATDGLRKKFNLIEYDIKEYKHSNEMMKTERNDHINRISELEIDLNNNRSDKLKLMHENSILKKKNQDLIEVESFARKDCLLARQELQEKLQNLDNLLNENENLKRLIFAQNEEMINLSHEVYNVKETYTNVNNQVVGMEAISSEHNKTIDILQHEISRLRKELMLSSIGNNSSHSNTAYGGGTPSKVNRIATAITNSAYRDVDGPYANSRRPMTEHGVSRERNRQFNRSFNNHYESSRIEQGGTKNMTLPHMLTLSPTRKYHYNDLEVKVEKALLENETGPKAIPVGATQQSLRNEMLKNYDDLLAPPIRSPHSLHESSTLASASTTPVCSPVATPHRRLHQIELQKQIQNGNKRPGTSGNIPQLSNQINASNRQNQNNMMKETVKNIKKCYSMPAIHKHKLSKLTIDTSEDADIAITREVSTAPIIKADTKEGRNGAYEELLDEDFGNIVIDSSDDVTTAIENNDNSSTSASIATYELQEYRTSDLNNITTSSGRKSKKNKPHQRTIYVGTGLGLRHNEELDNQIKNLNKGSTNQILKKILGDRFD